MTKLNFIKYVLLACTEAEVGARESHIQQAEASVPKLGLHSHRIGLLSAAFSDNRGTGGADPAQHDLIITTPGMMDLAVEVGTHAVSGHVGHTGPEEGMRSDCLGMTLEQVHTKGMDTAQSMQEGFPAPMQSVQH